MTQADPISPAFDRPVQSFANLSWGVAEELNDLRHRADRLQSALSQLLEAGSQPLDHGHYEQLQTLDYISQHLQGLAEFLTLLATERAAQTLVDPHGALSALGLSDLRERLIQSSCAREVEVDDDNPSWELF